MDIEDKKTEVDIEQQVMRKIKDENIRMRHPFIFLAQELGLQSVLILLLVGGALFISTIFYFMKKTGVLNFLSFGWPGLKVVILALPYDYIALFLISVILANYLFRKLQFTRAHSVFDVAPMTSLAAIAVLISIFFGYMGAEQLVRGWENRKVSNGIAISGRIIEASEGVVLVQEEDGSMVSVYYDKDKIGESSLSYEKNKILRAIGQSDPRNKHIFRADSILCCFDE